MANPNVTLSPRPAVGTGHPHAQSTAPAATNAAQRRSPAGPSKVTPISDAAPGSLADLNHLTGYDGSIQGTPLEEAIDEQRSTIHEAQAIIACANEYITHIGQGGHEWCPHLALDAVSKMLDRMREALEAGNFEDRALAIARAKRDESAVAS